MKRNKKEKEEKKKREKKHLLTFFPFLKQKIFIDLQFADTLSFTDVLCLSLVSTSLFCTIKKKRKKKRKKKERKKERKKKRKKKEEKK